MQPKKRSYRLLALVALFLALGSFALVKYLYLIPHVQIHQELVQIDEYSIKIVRETIYKGRHQSFLAQFWEPRLVGTNLRVELPESSRPITWIGEYTKQANAIAIINDALYVVSTSTISNERNCFRYQIERWNDKEWLMVKNRGKLVGANWILLGYNNKNISMLWPGKFANFSRPFGSLLTQNEPFPTINSKLVGCN